MATAMTASTASPPSVGIRFCASCSAIYRQDFQRCPVDGCPLVVGANDPWIGLTVGSHYVIEGLIGEGAMGRVYRAHHRQFRGRTYAIKILLGDLAASAQMRARFALEAEHAAKLGHPNVVGVIDFATSERGVSHMVMELVDGPTLGAILRKGPMDGDRVIALARQICEGLDHAHGRGMIHRDLKPDNILVVTNGTEEIARIADFGLALSKNDETRLTTTGVVCTPAYAAPEQLRGQTIDHRVDLYALGTTMFEMLSGGILPFPGELDQSVSAKLSGEAPSVHMVAPNVQPALVAIIGRLLSSSPDRRPRSARAVIRALEQALAAPRVAIKTDQTARLRAPAQAQRVNAAGESIVSAAPSTNRLRATQSTRHRRTRGIAMQLFACGLTLGSVLAWADARGPSRSQAEPTLAAVAEPASSEAARSIETTTELDVDALKTFADGVAASVYTDFAELVPPVELVLAPQRSLLLTAPEATVTTTQPTAVVKLVEATPTEAKPTAIATRTPPKQHAAPVRRVVRPRPPVAEPEPEPAPTVDVVEQMLSGEHPAAAEVEPTPEPTVPTPPQMPTPTPAAAELRAREPSRADLDAPGIDESAD